MNTTQLDKEIAKVAKSVVNSWPGVMEAEDVQQELWVRILESPKYKDQMETSDPALRFEFLKRLGMQIVGREVSSYELFSGNVYYGTDHVRALLEAGLLTINRWELGGMKETLTDFMDLHSAFDHMKNVSPEYAQVIWSAFADGDYNKEKPSARMKLSRAITSLTDHMNQIHRRNYAEFEDGLGTREVMSNARARAVSSNQWEGPRVF